MNIHASRFQENMQTLSLFFSWDEKRVPVKINTNMWSKIRDTSKRHEHSSKLVPKALHIERVV